jgi:hypothetical protein
MALGFEFRGIQDLMLARQVLLLLEPLHQPWMYHFANLKYLATSNC